VSLRNIPEGLQARLNTSYSVSIPEFPSFKYQPYEITIHQEERSHDVAILRYQMMSTFFMKGLKTGTAISFTWQNNPKAKGTFVGHITKVKRVKTSQLNQELEVHCVAASFPLKQTKTNTWVNKTVPEVVQDIAKQTKMKAIVTPHFARYSQISQYGATYWQFLNELAWKIGYVVYVKNAVIYFQDIDEVIDKQMGMVPLLNFEVEFAPPFHAPIERTLDKFEPIVSDFHEDERYPLRSNKVVGGVDPIKPKSYSTTKKPTSTKSLRKEEAQVIFDDNTVFDVVNSKMFADSLAQGKAARARMNMPAKFSGQGDPRIFPYGVVEVSGIDATVDGYWLVRSVTHTIHKTGHYTCEGVVVTDGRGLSKSSSTRRKTTGGVPTLNLTNVGNGDTVTLPKKPTLSKAAFTYTQKNSGYTLNKRTWKV